MTQSEAIQREKQIYENYQNIIAPLIVELEVRDLEYPVEVLNEIRSIFTHLSRFKIDGIENDLCAAEKHVKRAVLDCFKYICVSCANEICSFRSQYRNVDLSIADNGKFLSELNRLESVAKAAYISAKNHEIKMEISEDELYEKFQEAYNAYTSLIQYKDDSHEAILFASNHSKRSNTITLVSIVVTVVSIIIAVVSLSLS